MAIFCFQFVDSGVTYSSLYTLKLYHSGKRAPDRAYELRLGIHTHTTILATFLEISRTAVSMCRAGILGFALCPRP